MRRGGYTFLSDPAAGAARVFRAALRGNGLKVVGSRTPRVTVPESAADVAAVASAPLGEIVERTLEVSDNQAAEVLARHVGLAERQEGSFRAGAASVLDVVRGSAYPSTARGSTTAAACPATTGSAPTPWPPSYGSRSSPDHPELRHVFTGLPVAGFTGSLQHRFDTGPARARGRVRAKTGTLTGVHGLAGVADDVGGARMAFAVVADRVGPLKDLEAQVLIDRIAGALGACTCHVGS